MLVLVFFHRDDVGRSFKRLTQLKIFFILGIVIIIYNILTKKAGWAPGRIRKGTKALERVLTVRFEGLFSGIAIFFIIAVFHPMIIKCKCYFTDKIWPPFFTVGSGMIALSRVAGQVAVLEFSRFWDAPANQKGGGRMPKKRMALTETGFDIVYLGTVLLSGVLLCTGAAVGSERWLFGLMALILGVGDSFHLIPRMYALWSSGTQRHAAALGIGKLVASVTMTVFYVILWHIGLLHYPGITAGRMTAAVYALAALRIALCLFPQNRWTSESSALGWPVLRNLPFLALGMSVMALFAKGAYLRRDGLSFLWVAVLISFACYLPVVAFSGKNRRVGMLMIPKSCAYAAIVLMGFSLSGP